jgi:hypothetical protein
VELFIKPEQHEISIAARKQFSAALPNGWEDRLDVGGDYGVDDHIEILNEGWSTGLLLLVQRKGVAELPEPETTSLTFKMPVRTLHYAELFSPSFILALVPVNAEEPGFYYLWLQEYIRVVLDHDNPSWRANKTTVTVSVPVTNWMPGDEGRLAHIAAAPRRDREWALASRIAHEMTYAVGAGDLARAREQLDQLYELTAIFGVDGWGWSKWAQEWVLDNGSAALDALLRGGPFATEDLEHAGSSFGAVPEGWDEQELMESVLRSRVEFLPGQIGALLSTNYDDALAHHVQENVGDHSY